MRLYWQAFVKNICSLSDQSQETSPLGQSSKDSFQVFISIIPFFTHCFFFLLKLLCWMEKVLTVVWWYSFLSKGGKGGVEEES